MIDPDNCPAWLWMLIIAVTLGAVWVVSVIA